MNLDKWLTLSIDEQAKIRKEWKRNWENWYHLLDEAISRFTTEYGSHPMISRIDSFYDFGPADIYDHEKSILHSEPQIGVTTKLCAPERIEELPTRYATFTVVQVPYGDTKNRYLKIWKIVLGKLLGWSEEQVLEWAEKKHKDDLEGKSCWFDHECPCYYISTLFIPHEKLKMINPGDLYKLNTRLYQAIHRKGQMPCCTSPYDWNAARMRINKILSEI
jgi:hypothetical protein